MSPLFMETGSEPNSPSSLSAEDTRSNTAGSGREGDGQPAGRRGMKRQEKNRDAARKSRKKQTERADELHEELQRLEQSNSALQKEITSLRKDFQLYTMALERHKPFCSLRDSAAHLLVSPSTNSQPGPSPPRVSPQASTPAVAPSLSTSLTSTLDLEALKSLESPYRSSSAPTTSASSTASSSELFTRSGSVTAPYSVSFSAVSAPHSLFINDPPSPIRSRPTNVKPVCTSLFSNPSASSALSTAARPQSRQGAVYHGSSLSEACSSTYDPGAASFQTASFKGASPYSSAEPENTGLEVQGCSMNVPQLHSGAFTESQISSSLPPPLLTSMLQHPALQSFSGSNLELTVSSKPTDSRHAASNPASLLSLLTVPSPLPASQSTSSSLDAPLSQPPLSLPALGDPLGDLSLSELLEVNDWILQ
ncbi:basic leucine zipper transcriptional factor ATF-like 2 [Acanthopagrus latus]|uniref:basic leucine zipper transcriptional factor ATF-like 2 n=1 Tax=Acanthopagrus latus TaxID=8177 RepID=UPI00187CC729|nr:basic leucine zipper transcriptional factor ATF-like 2 [Acanthopagrus latus]XP_036967887.1 basic leucine zipper transcriptional factor ATF-like 2 [Acanthopagrus latus]